MMTQATDETGGAGDEVDCCAGHVVDFAPALGGDCPGEVAGRGLGTALWWRTEPIPRHECEADDDHVLAAPAPLRPLAPGRQRIAQLLTAASPGTVGAVYDPGADDVVQAALAMGAPVAPVLLGPSSLLASRTVWRWTRTS